MASQIQRLGVLQNYLQQMDPNNPMMALVMQRLKPASIGMPMASAAAQPTKRAGGGGGGPSSNTFAGSPIPGVRPHRSTHDTDGLPGYPAFDYMKKAGSTVVSPVRGRVIKISGKDPKLGGRPGGALGYSVYIRGDNGKTYFLTHIDRVRPKVGQRVSQGQRIAVVANGPASWSSPHVHMGVKG